ncbi:MAG: ATP-binding protein [Anaerolineales bacterium]|jgi:magnesium chelatase subunit I|nr:ATP-binding protein [Anaerolineales bacterium]
MNEPETTPAGPPDPDGEIVTTFRTLKDLINFASSKAILKGVAEMGESGIAEALPFPFLALVGQSEMKLALMLGLINPNIGGILLVGPRGTGKTTAVRSLLELLPNVERSTCYYGCTPEDVEAGGIDAICPECAQKYAAGQPLTAPDRVRLVELPLNSRIEDVVGGIDERAAIHERMRLRRGILAQADRNLLYIDEINLLSDEVMDAILDAAAQGLYTVRRGPVSATYRARFVLIGSMNPEEGKLRPQILDRFGLRLIVRGLPDAAERLEAYRRVRAYLTNPRAMIANYNAESQQAAAEIQEARKRLRSVNIPDELATRAIHLIQTMGIDSLRAEITWFEAARAYAAADGRSQVDPADLAAVAAMCLRLRRSSFMTEYFKDQAGEEDEMQALLKKLQ